MCVLAIKVYKKNIGCKCQLCLIAMWKIPSTKESMFQTSMDACVYDTKKGNNQTLSARKLQSCSNMAKNSNCKESDQNDITAYTADCGLLESKNILFLCKSCHPRIQPCYSQSPTRTSEPACFTTHDHLHPLASLTYLRQKVGFASRTTTDRWHSMCDKISGVHLHNPN